MTSEEYLSIARTIATCPKKRLPYVIETLRRGGFDLTDVREEIRASERAYLIKKEDRQRENRKVQNKNNWKETTDEFAIYLRKVYEDGINFTHVAKEAGVDRPSIYKYMWGEKKATPSRKNSILAAIEKIKGETETAV